MQYTFHVVGLPHTSITKEYAPCAYTQKVLNFCNMMHSLGHKVFAYGGPQCDAVCTEHVPLISEAEQDQFFGHVDWRKGFFPIEWASDKPYWQLTNARAIDRIAERKGDRDFICLISGPCQKPIAEAFTSSTITVEPFVGYYGTYCQHRVFESYSHMHHVYGNQHTDDGRAFDAVIHNFFDPSDFPVAAADVAKEDYYLFVGRMVRRKGLAEAVEMTRKAGVRLIMAGQGVIEQRPGMVRSIEYTAEGDHIEHIGVIDAKQRNLLMAKARAVLVPTQYIGPFEGVHAEALLCGTPVITTDWGVFPETVKDGVDGFRCRTLGEFVHAVHATRDLDPHVIRTRAMDRFSTDVLRHDFEDYFDKLYTLWGLSGDGWYDLSYRGLVKRERGSF